MATIHRVSAIRRERLHGRWIKRLGNLSKTKKIWLGISIDGSRRTIATLLITYITELLLKRTGDKD
jgi:hypothetical protein